ncbi:MAG: HAD-IIA family hydrolase [Nocardioides sp.]
MLKGSDTPLWESYDVAMLDLDGVVYIGPEAVPGAPEHLAHAAAAGMRLAYVTNNAARPPSVVAAHLRELGIEAVADDVVTSAQAAARLLVERCPSGSPVFVIGGAGLFEALNEQGLRPVQSWDEGPVAVVSGFSRDLTWGTVIDGALLVRDGLPWVASNTDMSVPTQHGSGPGNGVLVETVASFSGRTPVVAGKPQATLFEETLQRVGGTRPLVVGDRLDTDIEGAVNAGYDSLLVMTGVTGLEELVAAPEKLRPTYVSADLAGLGHAPPEPTRDDEGWRCGGWRACVDGERLEITGDGDVDDWWRVAANAGWDRLDTSGEPVDVRGLRPPSSVGHRAGAAAPEDGTEADR